MNAEEHYIQADSIRIHEVFWNLINNAVKFTPPGGTIDIRTRNDNRGRFQFEITDNGIGIKVERQAAFFTPFEQADPSGVNLAGLAWVWPFRNILSIFTAARSKCRAGDKVLAARSK